MKECIENDFERNKQRWIILGMVAVLAFLSIYMMTMYEKRYTGFHEQTLSEEDVQVCWTEYRGEHGPDQASALMQVYGEMKESNDFTLYEIWNQFIEWEHYEGPEQFCDGYEFGLRRSEGIDQSRMRNDQGDLFPTTRINSTQLSQNCMEAFDLKTIAGRDFQDRDFLLHFGEEIPVLMGYEYMPYYQIGETFDIFYLYGSFTCEIVGFLAEDSYIDSFGDVEYMDREVILPMFEIRDSPPTGEYAKFQTIQYANKTSGYLTFPSSLSPKEIAKEMHRITAENGVPDYIVHLMGKDGEYVAEVASNQMLLAVQIGKWLILLLCFGIFMVVFSSQMKSHLTDYAVYSLFVSYQSIIWALMIEMGSLLLGSLLAALLLMRFLTGNLNMFKEMLFFGALLLVFLAVYIFVKMKCVDFKKYLVEGKDEY